MKMYQTMLMMFWMAMSTVAFGQNTIELTFTAANNGQYVPIDSICIKNLTNGDAATLYPDDTTLILVITGLNDPDKNFCENFTMFQNSPNPFNRQTTIEVFIPYDRQITFEVTNLLGRKLRTLQTFLQRGFHNFSFNSGREKIYFLTIHYDGTTKTIKMINSGISDQNCCVTYSGPAEFRQNQKSTNRFTELDFTPGDELLMIGYFDGVESGFIDSPETSRQYVIQFARNVACPGLDSLLYAGQWYHTIQVLGQCWMKENLNAGIMIQSTQAQTNNNIIEKYCMGNEEYFCDIAGGLYFWNEMMSYTNETGGQGICPEGWHVPDDMDWQILEGAVDSAYNIGDTEWGNYGWRGTDAGGNLKQTGTEYWMSPNSGATDAFSFSALPGGYFVQGGFWGPGYKAYFWSSENGYKFYRNMDWDQTMIQKNTGTGNPAFSVRCVKN
jgi:uncharacterized protein (TIGR02145 family)